MLIFPWIFLVCFSAQQLITYGYKRSLFLTREKTHFSSFSWKPMWKNNSIWRIWKLYKFILHDVSKLKRIFTFNMTRRFWIITRIYIICLAMERRVSSTSNCPTHQIKTCIMPTPNKRKIISHSFRRKFFFF